MKPSIKTLNRKRTEKSNYKLIQKHVLQQSSEASSVFDEEINSNNVMHPSSRKQFLKEVMLEQNIEEALVPQQTVALTPFSP